VAVTAGDESIRSGSAVIQRCMPVAASSAYTLPPHVGTYTTPCETAGVAVQPVPLKLHSSLRPDTFCAVSLVSVRFARVFPRLPPNIVQSPSAEVGACDAGWPAAPPLLPAAAAVAGAVVPSAVASAGSITVQPTGSGAAPAPSHVRSGDSSVGVS